MLSGLSDRQEECLRLSADLYDQQIADRLDISVHTVRTHIRDAKKRLGVSDRKSARRLLLTLEGGETGVIAQVAQIGPVVLASTEALADGDRDIQGPDLWDHPWRPLPGGLRRLGLILSWSLLWLLIFAGGLQVAFAIFDYTQRLRDGAQ